MDLSGVIKNDDMQKILDEVSRLGDRTYLENAGSTLYPQSLLKDIHEDLEQNVYMNPHTDPYTKDCVDQVRSIILKHFHTDHDKYTVIFTSGTTQALKTVVESFQFCSDIDETINGSLVYLRDNHTSVLGLREIVNPNVDVIHITHEEYLNAIHKPIYHTTRGRNKRYGNTIFVFPAQSNFNGYKYPIKVDNVKEGCLQQFAKRNLSSISTNWYVLLDAASYVPSNNLDLSVIEPDFICMSFYKIFGYPTGLGALLVKNDSKDLLSKKMYFGGGTVDIVLSGEDFHVKRSCTYERFEDGTISFLSILALKNCFEIMNRIIPKVIGNNIMDTLSYHTFYLAKDLYLNLVELKHLNGRKAAVVYMDSDFTNIKTQGGTVTFNLLRDNGNYIGYAEFQHMADLFNINVRTGCFCNSGSCQRHLAATSKEMKEMHKLGHRCGDELDLIDGRPTGAIRVSFGFFNTYNDVDKLLAMITRCFVHDVVQKARRIKHTTKVHAPPPRNFQYSDINMNNYEEIIYNNVQQVIPSYDVRRVGKVTVTEIAIFPIKSCGAFKVNSWWKIGDKGFRYDREWMIVRDNGVCLTQKHCAHMCLIRPMIDLKNNVMVLNCKGMNTMSIPLDPEDKQSISDAKLCDSKVCTDSIIGQDCGDKASDWVSEALGISYLRLVRILPDSERRQKTKLGLGNKIALSNQAQFLLINKASVRWLKDQIRDTTFNEDIHRLIDRFRGNIVVDMDEALEEKKWEKLFIGKHQFKVEGPCTRCQMVCIDQYSGEKTVEPLRTISELFSGKMQFGVYLSYVGGADVSNDQIFKTYSTVKATSVGIGDNGIRR